ncbi:MAG: isoprenylcysteine carboxylmethyltransferase family protein [Planctomycetes bacterium]|nr:isoprenylcysteine carboxylmethyltransferase family protein [Planctomycetota bacterium]
MVYGLGVYAIFLATFTAVVLWLANVVLPKGIDGGEVGPLQDALLVNGAFLAGFAIQHAIMARTAFKRRWTKIVPAHLERSTFVLATCAILASMMVFWRPMPGTVWHVEGAGAVVLWTVSALGWGTVLLATFLIDHFALFGVRQVVQHARGRIDPPARFQERSLYRWVRHPLMTGFLLAFWATPHMTWGHLFFAAMCTGYIALGTRLEERTLVGEHGEAYLDYARRVPGFFPRLRKAA